VDSDSTNLGSTTDNRAFEALLQQSNHFVGADRIREAAVD